MMQRNAFFLILLLLMNAGLVYADAGSTYRSKYVGQELREIKTLSKEDIDELKNGEGWGLAKAAELNGVPGPAHLLEMKSEIRLSEKQIEQISDIYEKMKTDAVGLGLKLIDLERELNKSFETGDIDEKRLKGFLTRISDIYGQLRYTHLLAHLKTSPILTADQVKLYNKLRGYSSGDPCENIPEGHDPDMWKRHHNCD